MNNNYYHNISYNKRSNSVGRFKSNPTDFEELKSRVFFLLI